MTRTLTVTTPPARTRVPVRRATWAPASTVKVTADTGTGPGQIGMKVIFKLILVFDG